MTIFVLEIISINVPKSLKLTQEPSRVTPQNDGSKTGFNLLKNEDF